MRTREIAELLSGELIGDEDVDIERVASITAAGEHEAAFTENSASFAGTGAGCLIAPPDFAVTFGSPVVKVQNPKLAFALLAEQLHPRTQRPPEIHPSAAISDTAAIGEGVYVGPFAIIGDKANIGRGAQILAGVTIGDNVTIGQRCTLHPNVTVGDSCVLGDEVVIHAGVVIGADGFGYVRDENRYVKFPQIGSVVIENNVEIGANSCVDRGALGETRIGEGTKIDNLVQVGHNVQIGRRCVIAAQTGISGSTIIEDDCVIGGQVGFGDHVHVLSGAVIGSQAGVLPGKIVRPGVWWGTPIQPLDEYKRQNAHVKSLERMKQELRELKKRVAGLES